MTRLGMRAVVFSMLLGAMASCSDDKKEIKPKFTEQDAKTEEAAFNVPSGKRVFFDFKTNSTKDSLNSMVHFSGMYGSSLKSSRPDQYKMGYFDKENTSLEKLTIEEISTLTINKTDAFSIDASSAGQPATGPAWIIYDYKNNHAVYPTANRYIVMYKGGAFNAEADELYIVQAASVTAARGNADYKINVKKFVR